MRNHSYPRIRTIIAKTKMSVDHIFMEVTIWLLHFIMVEISPNRLLLHKVGFRKRTTEVTGGHIILAKVLQRPCSGS